MARCFTDGMGKRYKVIFECQKLYGVRGSNNVNGRPGVIPAATASLMRSMHDTTALFIDSSVFDESLTYHITLLFYVMLCYVMSCRVMSCCVMLCCAMLHNVMFSCDVMCRVMSYCLEGKRGVKEE